MTTAQLKPWLKKQEGYKSKPYRDSLGNWTGGVGHLLNGGKSPSSPRNYNNYTDKDWDEVFDDDIEDAEIKLDEQLSWWRKLSDVRQDVMVSLFFNLGPKLVTWKHTLNNIDNGNFKTAEIDLENDQPWASQVKSRAVMLAQQMETNIEVGYPDTVGATATKATAVAAAASVAGYSMSKIPPHYAGISVGTEYWLIAGVSFLCGILLIMTIAFVLYLVQRSKPANPGNLKEMYEMFLQSYQPILDYINVKQAQSVADAKTISDLQGQVTALQGQVDTAAAAEKQNETDTLGTLTAATTGDGITPVAPPAT